MNTAELRTKMLDYIPEEYFEVIERTPENINWMYAVTSIDNGEDDLLGILATLNDHFDGEFHISEGDGGCEARTNQELITSKIEFNIAQGYFCPEATGAAIKLGWLDAEDYEEEVLAKAI